MIPLLQPIINQSCQTASDPSGSSVGLAIYDPVAGNADPLAFPVPWARTPEMSHLLSVDETLAAPVQAGFSVKDCHDVTEPAIAWFDANAARWFDVPQPMGLHLLLGADWPAMAGNMARNIGDGRVRVVQIIATSGPKR